MNCFWKTVFIAFSYYVFFYVAESSVLPTITVVLNATVPLPFSGSCHGDVEWKHRHESKSTGVTHTTVATLHQGVFTPGVGFEDRVKRGDGDLYLTISSVVFNDNGWFECHCGKTQADVQFVVLVPIAVGQPAYVGSNFQLNFYGLTKKQTPDSEVHFYCEKDGQTVLNVMAGNITYGSGFENRVSVSNDAYRQGDMSFTINNLQRSDQGTYRFFFSSDHQRGNPEAVSFTVSPKEKHSNDTGIPTWVVLVLVVVLVIILVAVVFYFLGGRLKEARPAWFKRNCLRSQLSPCPEGEQGGEHLSVTISEGESETEDRIGTRTCFVPYAPACIIRALSGPPSTPGLVTKATDGPPSTTGLVTKATDGPRSGPDHVTNGTD